MAIRIEALGGLRVSQDGGERVELPRQKLRCGLLLFLGVERSATRERLVRILWPDTEPDRARRRLSQMVYELRGSLGTDWVEVRSERFLGTGELRTDVQDLIECVELGRVGEAASLYRGPFLGSLRLVETPEFERWVESQRSRLGSLYRDAQRTLVDRLLDRGDLSGALSAARRWVLAEPLDDGAQYRLIDLLARSGLRNEALRQYADYEERLSWIDAEPLESVTELVAALRDGSRPAAAPGDPRSAPSPSPDPGTGVVVLPIQNLSPDDTHQYFADGLAEEIMHVLGRVPGLRVVPRTSAFAFDQPGVRVRDAIEELGVTHALEGSVRFAGDRYRIRVALIEGSEERELWHDQVEGVLATTDVFELQDRIADAVVEALADRLGTDVVGETEPTVPVHRRSRAGETVDPEAHALYLRGRHAWFGRGVPDLDRALELFRRAVERDPSYARAWVGIADVYLVLGGLDYAVEPPSDLYGHALEAAERALALDPDLAEAHAAMANYLMNHRWDWEGAGEAFRRAISLNPGYSSARQWYSNYLMSLGKEDEALAEATLAREMDPRSAFLSSSLGRHYQLMRKPARAVEEFRRALELDPALLSARIGLAVAEMQAGDVDACLAKLRDASARIDREVPLLMALQAYASAITGGEDEAVRTLQRLKATRAAYLPPEYVAIVYVGLDEHDRAMDWLERAFEARSPTMTLLRMEPLFDPLRGRARFRQLLEDVGFQVLEAS